MIGEVSRHPGDRLPLIVEVSVVTSFAICIRAEISDPILVFVTEVRTG